MTSPNSNQPPQQQSAYQQQRNQLSAPTPMRRQEQVAEFSGDPLTLDSRLSAIQYTFQDPGTGEVVTVTIKGHTFLACSCRISSPTEIGGLCSNCSRRTRKGHWKKPQLVCRKHSLCISCRQKKLRELHGGGPLKKTLRCLLKIVLWPLFDVEESENATYVQTKGPLGEIRQSRPNSPDSSRNRTTPR
jgi:hypothetical protein